jgi:hypothetical protein
MDTEDLLRWYDENEELYKELTSFVSENAIKDILAKEGLEEGIEYAFSGGKVITHVEDREFLDCLFLFLILSRKMINELIAKLLKVKNDKKSEVN